MDLVYGLFGMLACISPFALIYGLVHLVQKSSGEEHRKRADALEWSLNSLRAEHLALLERVAKLEAAPVSVRAPLQLAPLQQDVASAIAFESAALPSAALEMAGPENPALQTPAPEAEGLATALEAAGLKSAESANASPENEESRAREAVVAARVSLAASEDDAPRSEAASIGASAASAPRVETSPSASGPLDASPSGAGAPPPPPASDAEESSGGFEQLIGVKGAAVLGALVLIIAGLYFFQYSIEHGLLGPELRIALGFVVGMACVGLSERPLRTLAPALSPWLAGAGIAILYSASWASSALYHLVPNWGAGALMVAVTGAATLLAIRRESLPIAVLGLLGGFITPLALSTGEDHPIPLFAYLLVLDGAILYVSHKRGWPSLGLMALIATTLYQLGWLGGRMSDETALIGLSVIVVFSALFALLPRRPSAGPQSDDLLPLATRVGATLLPFLFVLTFVFRDGVTFHGWPTLAIIVLASLGSLFVARRESMGWVGTAASIAATVVTATYVLRWWSSDADYWPLVLLLGSVPLIFHGALEFERFSVPLTRIGAGLPVLALLGTLGFTASLGSVGSGPQHPNTLLVAFFGLLVLGLRQSSVIARNAFPYLLAVVSAVSMFAIEASLFGPRSTPSGSFLLACQVAPLVLFTLAAVLARAPTRPALDLSTAIAACATLLLLALGAESLAFHESLSMGVTLALSFVLGVLSTGRTAPPWVTAAVVACAALCASLYLVQAPDDPYDTVRFGLLFAMVLFGTAWPLLAKRVGASDWGWRAAALTGPMFFLALRRVWEEAFGDAFVGALPVMLGALVLGTAVAARQRTASDPATQRIATVWLAAVAAGFVTLAIPLQLSNEWLTIGWALEATALLALDSRLRHAGLRYFALVIFALVAIRLCPVPYLLEYHERGPWRIVNWLSYTYLVPSACFLIGSALLSRYELAERLPKEKEVFGAFAERPILSGLLFSGVVALVFAWLNLTIVDWYATGPYLVIPTDLVPARGLAISAAWAFYALLLLGLGMRQSSTALRMTSLLLLMATCGKVFLHDLSNLGDLYRVAALVCLAFSLIAVSFFYQRFVFRRQGQST